MFRAIARICDTSLSCRDDIRCPGLKSDPITCPAPRRGMSTRWQDITGKVSERNALDLWDKQFACSPRHGESARPALQLQLESQDFIIFQRLPCGSTCTSHGLNCHDRIGLAEKTRGHFRSDTVPPSPELCLACTDCFADHLKRSKVGQHVQRLRFEERRL